MPLGLLIECSLANPVKTSSSATPLTLQSFQPLCNYSHECVCPGAYLLTSEAEVCWSKSAMLRSRLAFLWLLSHLGVAKRNISVCYPSNNENVNHNTRKKKLAYNLIRWRAASHPALEFALGVLDSMLRSICCDDRWTWWEKEWWTEKT